MPAGLVASRLVGGLSRLCGATAVVAMVVMGNTVLPASAAGRTNAAGATPRPGAARPVHPSYYPGRGSYLMIGADGSVYPFGPTARDDGTLGGTPLSKPIVGGAIEPFLGEGYWLVGADGGIFAYTAPYLGSEGGQLLNAPIVGMAADNLTGGYWEVAADGGIFSFTAPFYGSTGDLQLNAPIVGMAVTPTSKGYWLVASDGGVFSFGAAANKFYGSTGDLQLNAPIVGMAPTPTGNGYYLVASDGGVFSFSKTPTHPAAPFHGSTGSLKLNKPIVGMGLSNTDGGYWLVASDGGVFAFTAPFVGSEGGTTIPAPVVAMLVEPPPFPYVWSMAVNPAGTGYWLSDIEGGANPYGTAQTFGTTFTTLLTSPMIGIASDHSGNGYWMAQTDGAVHQYGDAPTLGSAPASTSPIVAIVATPTGLTTGYWLVSSSGAVYAFGGAANHGTLPSLGVEVNDVVGLVSTNGGTGYDLVGRDGGVFVFPTGQVGGFFGSLPGEGIQTNTVVGAAGPPTGEGYLFVTSDGTVYSFGTAPLAHPANLEIPGSARGVVIAPTDKGYWVFDDFGNVYALDTAKTYPLNAGPG